MYKQDLALNNLQGLIYFIKPNQSTSVSPSSPSFSWQIKSAMSWFFGASIYVPPLFIKKDQEYLRREVGGFLQWGFCRKILFREVSLFFWGTSFLFSFISIYFISVSNFPQLSVVFFLFQNIDTFFLFNSSFPSFVALLPFFI